MLKLTVLLIQSPWTLEVVAAPEIKNGSALTATKKRSNAMRNGVLKRKKGKLQRKIHFAKMALKTFGKIASKQKAVVGISQGRNNFDVNSFLHILNELTLLNLKAANFFLCLSYD